MKSNFIERNVEILDADGSIGVLSCILVDQEGKNWFTGGSFRRGLPVNLTDDFEGIRTVDFVAGTAPFYRREVFDRIGLFDENYRMYHEDVEFGLRLRAKTDYKACMFAEKLVVHYAAPSIQIPLMYYLDHRNNILILRKYCPRYLPKVLLGYTLEITRLLLASITIEMTQLLAPYMLKSIPRLFVYMCALGSIRGVLCGLGIHRRGAI